MRMQVKKEDRTAFWIATLAAAMREKEKSIITGNMRCAMFIHKVSRNREPQLCAHRLIINQNTKKRPPRIAHKAAVFGDERDWSNQKAKEMQK